MIDDLLEPLKVYDSKLKNEHRENTIKYFDELVNKSGIDIEKNRAIIKKLNETKKQFDKVNGYIKKQKLYKGLLIALIVILMLVGIFSFSLGLPTWAPIVILCSCALISVGLIFLIIKKINSELKELQNSHDLIKNAIDKLTNEAYLSMQPLNLLYDWNIPAAIINRSNSLIHLDKYLDPKKFQYLKDKFGLSDNNDENVSTYYVQSGSILGNPFMICDDYRQDWGQKTYTGSITIHWTERVKTQDGYSTVTRSQLLTASVVKPLPIYRYVTYLLYGNEAAPNLIFSRAPSELSGEDDALQYRKVRREAKKLDKKAERELMDNDPTTNYTRFGNDEFEVIFGGTDRNNELEYRLLFTPLAQRNLLDLLNNAKPFGDDFYMDKVKKLNYIQSRHSQAFNYNCNPEMFVDYDYDRARDRFIEYNTKYFESFFFDIAPLISIPLYQQTKTEEYIYNNAYEGNVTSYEDEVLANSFPEAEFKHPASITSAILKCSLDKSVGKADQVKVTAHSFKGIPHIELVPTLGGDGRLHNVPVEWVEYSPIEQERYMAVLEKDSSRLEYINNKMDEGFRNTMNGIGGINIYQRGLFATLLNKELDNNDIDAINKYYKSNSNLNNPATLREYLTKTINELRDDLASGLTSDSRSVADNVSNVQGSNEQ